MAKNVKITEKDNGANEMLKDFKKKRKMLSVGVLPPDSEITYPGTDTTIGEVALFQEFGTTNIPARPFMRAWTDENQQKIREELKKALQKVILHKGGNEAKALSALGKKYARQVKARVRAGTGMLENAQATIDKKGKDTPLIDTERMVEAIDFEVK